MALWKDQVKPSQTTETPPTAARFDAPPAPELKPEPIAAPVAAPAPAAARERARSESLIAPDLAIEGKIEGAGHVRIAGRFKGDVDVHGDLSIEPGAHVTGSVRAEKVLIGGELIGNIDSATHVELLKSGALTGDLKAATLTVASGSRMRGRADFGWDDTVAEQSKKNAGYGAASAAK
ncbi:MAG TPA: polymer-forming cytoskeletal protein [Rudaea sp.]